MSGQGVVVTLPPEEFRRAATIGFERSMQDLEAGLKGAYGAKDSQRWQMHIEGACAEAVLAKHLGIPWDGNLGNLDAADVGHLQVRSTSWEPGELRIHPKDKGGDIFILAVGLAPTFTLKGWLYAIEGKKKQFWKAPQKGRWAFFVPIEFLNPMSTLPLGGVGEE